MLAFIGPCPFGTEVLHIDGRPTNNAIDNLKYGTHRENCFDTYRHGAKPTGDKSHLARVSNADIANLKALSGKVGSRVAAMQFGISDSYVREIWRGKARIHG